MPKKAFKDDEGINRLSIVPSQYEDAKLGVPADVYDTLSEFYGNLIPDSFRQRLYSRLWDLGLREPSDFVSSDASDRYKQALRHAINSDSTDAIRFVLDTLKKD